MESMAPDVDFIVNNKSARHAFKCSKWAEISRDGDATILSIFLLDDVITATIEILKRNVLRKAGMVLEIASGNSLILFKVAAMILFVRRVQRAVRQVRPLGENYIGKEAKLRWILVGFINLTCPSLTNNS